MTKIYVKSGIKKLKKTLDDHEKRINTLEKDGATLTAEIKHLCNQIKMLNDNKTNN